MSKSVKSTALAVGESLWEYVVIKRPEPLGIGGYTSLIAVALDCQGKGIGAALLKAYEQRCLKASTRGGCFLLAHHTNVKAHRFYERLNYRKVGELPSFVMVDVSEVIYWKPFAQLGDVSST
ncbi:hypothetical protein BZG36_01100 [Bifiguratus adelaidae]|uniref:N-acetyltransferase domain-containing protein n=1 Tax=Bifiguratus adelaidae TaxID=1938954 RepID=A0A261Y6A9_9FUNG|nr:hypothetical protein BZG36_01100 [Bifiguratus adelaidae]